LWGHVQIKSNQLKFESNAGFFEEREKQEYPGKNLSEQTREPTNSTHIWHTVWKSNTGYTGEGRVLSPLRHHCSQKRRRMIVQYIPT